MAEVYRRVNGMKIEKTIALTMDVQAALMEETMEIAGRAEVFLAQHRDKGDSFIEIESGRVDRYVTLNDLRGMAAAMSIEYGKGRGDGTWVLHRAAYKR